MHQGGGDHAFRLVQVVIHQVAALQGQDRPTLGAAQLHLNISGLRHGHSLVAHRPVQLQLHGHGEGDVNGWRGRGGDLEADGLAFGDLCRQTAAGFLALAADADDRQDGDPVVADQDDGGGVARRRGQPVAAPGHQSCSHSAVGLHLAVIVYGKGQQGAAAGQDHLAWQGASYVVAFLGHCQLHGQAAQGRHRGEGEERLGTVCLGHPGCDGGYADQWPVVVYDGDGGMVGRRFSNCVASAASQGHRHGAVRLWDGVVLYGKAQQGAAIGQGHPAWGLTGQIAARLGHAHCQGQVACRGRRCGDGEQRLGAACLMHPGRDSRYADLRLRSIVVQHGDSGGVIRRRGEGVASPGHQGHQQGAVRLVKGVIVYGKAQDDAAQSGALAAQGHLARRRAGQVAVATGHHQAQGQALGWRRRRGDEELRLGAGCLGHGLRDGSYAERRLGAGASCGSPVVIKEGDGSAVGRRRGKGVASPGLQRYGHCAVGLQVRIVVYGKAQDGAAVGQGHQAWRRAGQVVAAARQRHA